ncbi:MAG: HDIG domain-containing protein [Candidatus Thermoplasmatota archaeon]|nr:HDIG domain-containing protein [Candidatus Thermoplasmatota archaeon]
MDVLRMGHRPERDKRITTHVALAARAFGADSIHIDTPDAKLEETVKRVVEQFGGDFSVRTGVSPKGMMKHFKGCIVHLTMYGMPLESVIDEVPNDDLLIVVGSEKVPGYVFDMANFNISVTDQPHSEVSALAIFLYRLAEESPQDRFKGAKMRILPSRRDKKVAAGEGNKDRIPPYDPIPDPTQCLDILEHIGCSEAVVRHVKAVHCLGMEVLKKAVDNDPSLKERMDVHLAEAGLLLHDIGRSRTHSIKHVTEGVSLARALGLDRRILCIIHNHVGAGLTAEEAVALGLPFEEHIPITIEEKFVCHVDSLIGNRKRRSLSDAVEDLRSKGAFEGAKRMEALHEELERFLGLDLETFIR